MTPAARTKAEQDSEAEQKDTKAAQEEEQAKEEPKELTEEEKVEQERVDYHDSIQEEIRAQNDEPEPEELPDAEARYQQTEPAAGQKPGDHVPVG